jgi:hypothetical protein
VAKQACSRWQRLGAFSAARTAAGVVEGAPPGRVGEGLPGLHAQAVAGHDPVDSLTKPASMRRAAAITARTTRPNALRSPGPDPDQSRGGTNAAGYLAYKRVAGWRHVQKAFAYARTGSTGLRTTPAPEDGAYTRCDPEARRRLTIRDIGGLSRHVADASRPRHVSVYLNVWGNSRIRRTSTTPAIPMRNSRAPSCVHL